MLANNNESQTCKSNSYISNSYELIQILLTFHQVLFCQQLLLPPLIRNCSPYPIHLFLHTSWAERCAEDFLWLLIAINCSGLPDINLPDSADNGKGNSHTDAGTKRTGVSTRYHAICVRDMLRERFLSPLSQEISPRSISSDLQCLITQIKVQGVCLCAWVPRPTRGTENTWSSVELMN